MAPRPPTRPQNAISVSQESVVTFVNENPAQLAGYLGLKDGCKEDLHSLVLSPPIVMIYNAFDNALKQLFTKPKAAKVVNTKIFGALTMLRATQDVRKAFGASLEGCAELSPFPKQRSAFLSAFLHHSVELLDQYDFYSEKIAIIGPHDAVTTGGKPLGICNIHYDTERLPHGLRADQINLQSECRFERHNGIWQTIWLMRQHLTNPSVWYQFFERNESSIEYENFLPLWWVLIPEQLRNQSGKESTNQVEETHLENDFETEEVELDIASEAETDWLETDVEGEVGDQD